MSNKKAENESQADKFREAAREHETDDREEALDRTLKRIAKAAPTPKPEKQPSEYRYSNTTPNVVAEYRMSARDQMTLEQFSRALAAHALITVYPNELSGFFAPERAEQIAEFIRRFALGEKVDRPKPPDHM